MPPVSHRPRCGPVGGRTRTAGGASSHCSTHRTSHPAALHTPPLQRQRRRCGPRPSVPRHAGVVCASREPQAAL
eukprot:2061449-Prymnesium_polylepis.1